MREVDRDPGRLSDILMATENVRAFMDGCSFEIFLSDKMRYYAVLKNIEIIGEAAFMLTNDYKKSHPDIPWEQMVKMRHILVHDYATFLPEILWETATVDVPNLQQSIKEMLAG